MGRAWPRHDDHEFQQRFQRTECDDEDGGELDEVAAERATWMNSSSMSAC
jgi:hypothetical protein